MLDFELLVAGDQRHLLELLAENPDARLVAGATDFIPLVGAGKWKPRLAIDITRVDQLHGCRISDGWLYLGPLTTHAEAASSPLVRSHATALADACATVADPLIRGVGVACGCKNIGYSLGWDDHAGAVVEAWPDHAVVKVGACDVGQGSNTIWTQIVASRLGLPTPGAIGAAVYDAVGVWIDDLPISPERVLRALRKF